MYFSLLFFTVVCGLAIQSTEAVQNDSVLRHLLDRHRRDADLAIIGILFNNFFFNILIMIIFFNR